VGHTNAVSCVAFQPPSGRSLVTGSVDGTLRIWSVADGKCLRILGERSTDKIWCCAVDPTGTMVVAGGSDQVLRVWRLDNGSVVCSLPGHKGVIRSVAFSPAVPGLIVSGEGNLTWGSDNSVRMWQMRHDGDGLCKSILLGHMKMVTCVAFPPDGSLLATASRDNTCRVWRVTVADPSSAQDQSYAPAPHSHTNTDSDSRHLKTSRTRERGPLHVPATDSDTGAPQTINETAHTDAGHEDMHHEHSDTPLASTHRVDGIDRSKMPHMPALLGSATTAGKVAGKIKVVTAKVRVFVHWGIMVARKV
jgi:WD40 repeat protein